MIIVAFLLVFAYIVSTFQDGTPTQSLSSAIPNLESTLQYEKTALAVFTENPTLALSSTPFYAEIIYNEAIRRITATPSIPSDCVPVADFFVQRDLAEKISNSILLPDKDIFVEITTSGVWGVEETCSIFQPVFTDIEVWTDIESDNGQIENDVTIIIDAIEENINDSDEISPINSNIYVNIYFDSEARTKISANWATINDFRLDAGNNGNIVQSLGGLQVQN